MFEFIKIWIANLKGNEKAKEKILLIENKFESLEVLIKALSNKYELLIAPDGETGIQKARLHRPSLIILNLRLNKAGKQNVSAEIKNFETTELIPILMIAEKADDSILGEINKHKGVGLITEPLTKDQILMEIKIVLNKRKQTPI